MKKNRWFLSLVILVLSLWLSGTEVRAQDGVLENEAYRLELTNEYSELQLTDKATGRVWSSSMSDPNFDLEGVSARWQERMRSLFTISTTDLKIGVGAITNFSLAGTDYTARPYETEEGFGVQYDLKVAGIKLCLEFGLTDRGLSVKVPSAGIEEYNNFSLVSLDLMSFFGAAADGQEGYLFYPDGSGAILSFDDPAHIGESSVIYDIYGDIQNNQNLKGRFEEEKAQVLLPVFGANYGEDGFVAYITSGEESSRITVSPSGTIVRANYIYPSFQFRRGFDDPRVTSKSVKKYDDERIMTDYEIVFEILPRGKAEYADMAVAYRDWLLEHGELNNDGGEKTFLSLDLFMGILEDGLIFDTFQSVTDFAQAREILEDLDASLGLPMDVTLVGWTKSGYGTEPRYFPANRKLGGNKGLRSLAEYAAEQGIRLSLAANFLTVEAEASGYSQNVDIVYLGNFQVLTNLRQTIRVFAPGTALKNFNKFLKKAVKYPLAGLKLENLGDMLYYSYGSRNFTTAVQCKDDWRQMLSKTREAFGSVTSEGGNLYTLSYSDKVTEIPDRDIGYQMTTREVPFYQIVTHGLVQYTGEALNLSSDADKLRLKWIEYGYTPYFELTYESAEKLINTDYNELFTSKYSDWKEELLETCRELWAVLGRVQDAKISSHEEIQEDVFVTEYDNGVRIYVNYKEETVTVDGTVIEGMSWEVRS